MIRDIPFSMLQMSVYEGLKHRLSDKGEFMNYKKSMMVGLIAGLTAAVLTNPLDVIKTNIMT